MPRPYDDYKDTPLWRSLAEVLAELEASKEISVSTGADYVVGRLCERLVAGRLVAPKAFTYDP
jgi:hypothetical protein